jgi:plasmid stability protein
VVSLAAISVRNLDDEVRERLRIRAAQHGRSMESEVRAILVEAVSERADTNAKGLFQTLMERVAEIGGVELDIPPRSTPVRAHEL